MADVDELRLRRFGQRIRAETGIVVGSRLGISEPHDIANEANHRLLHDVPRPDDVTVHVSPRSEPGQDHHSPLAHHQRDAVD